MGEKERALTKEYMETEHGFAQKAKQDVAVRVGAQIKDKRTRMGMTLEELCIITGISQPHLCRIEKGKANVTIETIACIASALRTQIII